MKKGCFKGCFCSKEGFTLIELLVVVLIIGILAAVAVPQYQKAVEKSRAAQALAVLDSAYKQATLYYIENGTYPNTFSDMGFDIGWPVVTSASLKWARNGYEKETLSDGTWSLQLYHASSGGLIIIAGLATGKYAGGGFEVVVVNNDRSLFPKDILCVERINNGIAFGGDPGDYCEKIMHATFRPGGATQYRVYDMP